MLVLISKCLPGAGTLAQPEEMFLMPSCHHVSLIKPMLSVFLYSSQTSGVQGTGTVHAITTRNFP